MAELRFTKSHEWVRVDGGVATVGITKYAAEQLGDVVFVELPEAGKKVAAGGEIAVVESVKAASEVYAPVSGEVIEVQRRAQGRARQGQRRSGRRGLVLPLKVTGTGRARKAHDQGSVHRLREGTVRLTDALSAAHPRRPPRHAGQDRRVLDRRSVPRRAASRARAARFDLPPHAGEIEVERTLTALAERNTPAGKMPFFCGAGAYRHHVPATVDHLIQRSEFLTSYTPYQPEIAQGTLQVLFEFQTQVALLTGMEVANASMYDGSTATAEAVLMARRVTGPQPRGPLRQPASALRRHRAHDGRARGRDRRLRPSSAGSARRPRRADRRRTPPASSCRTPTSSARCAI